VVDLIFPFLFQERAGDAHDDGEHGNEGKQGGIGEGGSAYRTTIAGETAPNHHAEMAELLELGELDVGAEEAFGPYCVGLLSESANHILRHAVNIRRGRARSKRD